ncbi:MAG: hypothetical protein N3E45_05115 [Oscillatoriaceae bacterium SKW80]|nr:hypothetical protein [Oscillatoriaceae bacterium SKYG93]MCX8120194.1 hypothetical protein [Oscillatoriaceae bacterium SKW80]MDW8453120.1 hypothetical protein [Oscillatoriaceae cyanobacterium SKYGB_i_bin93]HIK28969.1 hypothetical protein [Oscillatoriaceae cyanobacterium M7585_C2015_266]
METCRKISLIAKNDEHTREIGTLISVRRRKDLNHLQRRQQQRAITNSMIQIALTYGCKSFSRGALIFTLNDRSLRGTPYYKYINVLRGLRVVCLVGPPNPKILTAYWHEKTKRRVRI